MGAIFDKVIGPYVIGMLRPQADARPGIEPEPSVTPMAVTQKYASAHEQIEVILKDIEAAQVVMEQSSADGPARQVWYDFVVAGAVIVAQNLLIPLTIGGDRSRDPYDTPFVRLVKRLESLLPLKMQSRSMAACAKRIERSPAWSSKR